MTTVHHGNIDLLACPAAVKTFLGRYARDLAEAAGGMLLGAYVYGSLARGCFHPATSDVDVLAVTDGPCPEPVIRAVLRIHAEAPCPVDAVFATRGQLDEQTFPAPIDFLIKPGPAGGVVRLPDGSRDFPLQRQDTHGKGVAVIGPPASEMIGPLPWQLVAEALEYLFPHVVPRFKNPALTLCRIAHAHAHHALCSKREAGRWALEAFPSQWHRLIREELACYAEGRPATDTPPDQLAGFERFCSARLAPRL